MSGDVQPRKRKDKKRRKDEGEQIPIQTHAPPSPTRNPSSDDVNIHVHKEGGTGGGICAKLVFFVLLSALAVVIGMVITQYRGLTDVDTVDTESRYSQIFAGWIDSSHDHHDDHIIEETLDDHEDDHDEDDDEHNASEDEEHDEEEEEHELSEEEDEEVDDDEDTEASEERNEVDEDEDEDEDEEEEDEDEEQAVEESEENQLDEDDEEDEDVQASEERETYDSEEKDDDEDEDEDEDDKNDDEDHDEDEQDLENIGSEEGKDDDDDVSAEKRSGEIDDEQEEDEDDADVEKATVSPKKVEVKEAGEDGTHEEKTHQESAGMAVKLGVGVALLVVAHLVLVRKWRTAPDDKPKPAKEESNDATPNLSRRNTIVMPPTFQEVEPDIEPEEEDYSEEEELSDEEPHEIKSAKTRYQELRSTYTRSLTPEGEIDSHKSPETYEDEYEENVEDEEDEEEVSEEEEEEKPEGESEEEEDEEYDEDEDEELLKRLEAKYGKLRGEGAAERQADVENSDSEKSDDDAGYQFSNITSKDDYKIKGDIDEAQKSVQNNSAYAFKLFDKILQNHPSSPRSIYGKALALDYLADQRRSNEILEQALKFYTQLFNTPNVPNALFEAAAERCINRMRFVGQYRNAINVHKLTTQRFPNNPRHLNDLAVTYLTINRVEEARSVLKQILSKWPSDGFALVHYGFILKTTDNKLEEAVDYLQRGLDTRAEGVIDGRFYFHLGDALARMGKNDEAMKVYEEGVKNKVFLSKYQRSLYNVPRLTGKAWWNLSDLPYQDLFRLLKQNWKKIREEGLAVLNEKGYFQDESENLKDTGDWKQFELFARGQKNPNCKVCPITCSIIERIPEARGCKRGQTKFSVMHPGTHVWPHCGPTNCRLRVHLGLKVPPKTFIRVADETRSWEEGEVFVFDDSFEHEVWHNGTEFRLVLIADIWHPELTAAEKRSLSPI